MCVCVCVYICMHMVALLLPLIFFKVYSFCIEGVHWCNACESNEVSGVKKSPKNNKWKYYFIVEVVKIVLSHS